ncbi:hypothetical protein ACPWSR_03930 [Alloiococcus sp. CFN-8]|uniref:hypothetical protein n=1 Tax=Alloiococcus sp. CFN-8 TaxID=3416081 RepID=UPI003CF02BCC
MENEQKLGAGIITISILMLIGTVISILATIFVMVVGDSLNSLMLQTGQVDASMIPTTGQYIFGLVTTLISGISVILILMKNKYGIFGYFGLFILNTVYNIIVSGTAGTAIISLIISIAIAALYGYFIYKKRALYGFVEETV